MLATLGRYYHGIFPGLDKRFRELMAVGLIWIVHNVLVGSPAPSSWRRFPGQQPGGLLPLLCASTARRAGNESPPGLFGNLPACCSESAATGTGSYDGGWPKTTGLIFTSPLATALRQVPGQAETALQGHVLKPGEIKEIAYEIMDPTQQAEFELEQNIAISIPQVGRFRINIFVQRNEVGIVARNIVTTIPNWQDLNLPEGLLDVVMSKRGLILFVGATGSGKSTSLAALIDYRNSNSGGHIITIEDPVEYVHKHKKCIINQREVGVDTRSWHAALKNTLRQAPDVILIGEIRDRETMEHALAFAETGHLAISTLHANNANQALDRIINFFPEERRAQLLMDLSSNFAPLSHSAWCQRWTASAAPPSRSCWARPPSPS